MMRKIFSFLLLFLLSTPFAQADTIHLKNGSVIKGKVASFADDQFIVLLDTGNGRYMSRAMIYMGDVSRIEFDSAPAGAAESTPREQASEPAPVPTDSTTGDSAPKESQTRTSTPAETPPIARDPSETPPARDPEPGQPEKTSDTTPAPVTETPDAERATRKLTGQVKTQTVDVVARRDWTSTGLIIKRGDFIRITATGTVTLDQASGRTSGPEGIELADPRKLMGDQPTGALIGVIGADNDDFIMVGRSAEFTATRDGLLFLSVNEGALSDNSGSYKALIEVQVQPNKKP
jgi:sRNA-binding regulator protein Hfq